MSCSFTQIGPSFTVSPTGEYSPSPHGKIFGLRLVLRNAAANHFGELELGSCVNRVKTRRHHLVHESREGQVGLGPLLSCPVLKVTWQLTSDRAACPSLDFSECLSLLSRLSAFQLFRHFFLKLAPDTR